MTHITAGFSISLNKQKFANACRHEAFFFLFVSSAVKAIRPMPEYQNTNQLIGVNLACQLN